MSILNKKKSGFTLMEAIVAMSIGVLITVVVVSVSISSIKAVKASRQVERFHSNALHITNSVGFWVRQSKRIELINPSTLKIILPDFREVTVTLSSGKILVDSLQITSNDITVRELKMVTGGNSVRMAFTLESALDSKVFSATTTVARRNAL